MIGAAQQVDSAGLTAQASEGAERRTEMFRRATRRVYGQMSPFRGLPSGREQAQVVVGLRPTVDLAANTAGTMLVGSALPEPSSVWSSPVWQRLTLQGTLVPAFEFQRGDPRIARSQSTFGAARSDVDAVDRVLAKSGVMVQENPTPYLSLIWSLVEAQQLKEARALLTLVPDTSEYIRLKELLSVPVASVSTRRDVDRRAEYSWLARHSKDYTGRWVAVSGESLVAVGDTLKEVRQLVRDLVPGKRPLVHFVE